MLTPRKKSWKSAGFGALLAVAGKKERNGDWGGVEADTLEENPLLFREYITAQPDKKVIMDT